MIVLKIDNLVCIEGYILGNLRFFVRRNIKVL